MSLPTVPDFIITLTSFIRHHVDTSLLVAMPKDGGLSKNVVIAYGGRRHARRPVKQKTTANKSQKEVAKEKEAHAYQISGSCTSSFGLNAN
jgi:hypothetical protein